MDYKDQEDESIWEKIAQTDKLYCKEIELSEKKEEKKDRKVMAILCSALGALSGVASIAMFANSHETAAATFGFAGLIWLTNAIYEKFQMSQIDKRIKELNNSQNDERDL